MYVICGICLNRFHLRFSHQCYANFIFPHVFQIFGIMLLFVVVMTSVSLFPNMKRKILTQIDRLIVHSTALYFVYIAIHISHNPKLISYIEYWVDTKSDLLNATVFYNIIIYSPSKSPFQSKQWDKIACLQFAYLHKWNRNWNFRIIRSIHYL